MQMDNQDINIDRGKEFYVPLSDIMFFTARKLQITALRKEFWDLKVKITNAIKMWIERGCPECINPYEIKGTINREVLVDIPSLNDFIEYNIKQLNIQTNTEEMTSSYVIRDLLKSMKSLGLTAEEQILILNKRLGINENELDINEKLIYEHQESVLVLKTFIKKKKIIVPLEFAGYLGLKVNKSVDCTINFDSQISDATAIYRQSGCTRFLLVTWNETLDLVCCTDEVYAKLYKVNGKFEMRFER